LWAGRWRGRNPSPGSETSGRWKPAEQLFLELLGIWLHRRLADHRTLRCGSANDSKVLQERIHPSILVNTSPLNSVTTYSSLVSPACANCPRTSTEYANWLWEATGVSLDRHSHMRSAAKFCKLGRGSVNNFFASC
jgi:hypothetical protein